MNKITEHQFALLCYLALINDLDHTVATYIESQFNLLVPAGYAAFDYIPKDVQARVITYCEIWEIELPKFIRDRFLYA